MFQDERIFQGESSKIKTPYYHGLQGMPCMILSHLFDLLPFILLLAYFCSLNPSVSFPILGRMYLMFCFLECPSPSSDFISSEKSSQPLYSFSRIVVRLCWPLNVIMQLRLYFVWASDSVPDQILRTCKRKLIFQRSLTMLVENNF